MSPLRRSMEPQPNRTYLDNGDGPGIKEQLKSIHANALPGVLRPEEGEESQDPSRTNTPGPADSPAKSSLRRSYASLEAQREHERYSAYLDELDSEKLPNAFNMGWKQNLLHVFGHQPLLWWLPVCNTSGDGWAWDVSPRWLEARDELAREREQRRREEQTWARYDGDSAAPPPFEPPAARRDYRWTPGQGFVNQARNAALPPPPRGGSSTPLGQDSEMQPIGSKASSETESYDTSSSDEDVKRMYAHQDIIGTQNWNDVPDNFLRPGRRTEGGAGRDRSRGRKGKGKGD